MSMYESKGSVYLDTYSKVRTRKDGTVVRSKRWVAEITIEGKRFRHRSVNKSDCEAWLESLQKAIILPSQNGVDWRKPKPEDMDALKEIPGFPGYYVDGGRMEAWSFVKRGHPKRRKEWQRLIPHNGTISVQRNGRRSNISLAKSIFAACQRIPYDDERLRRYRFRIQDGKVLVEGCCDNMHRATERKKSYIDQNRKRITQHRIDVLKMVLLAYNGEPSQLLEYAISQKQRYIRAIKSKFPTASDFRVTMGYEQAYDKLVDVIDHGGSDIAEFDGWFVKTARGFVANGVKKIVFEENKFGMTD